MPWTKLNTTIPQIAHVPQKTKPARTREVRGWRRVVHSPATRPSPAAGISQLIWDPRAGANVRGQPGWLPKWVALVMRSENRLASRLCGSEIRYGLDVPRSRPNPLYPKMRETSELSPLLSTYGRLPTGHNSTTATHQPEAITSTSAPQRSWTSRRPSFGRPKRR